MWTSVADAAAAAAVSQALSAIVSVEVATRLETCRWVAHDIDQALTVLEDSRHRERDASDRSPVLAAVRRALTELAVGGWDEARRALIEARGQLSPRVS